MKKIALAFLMIVQPLLAQDMGSTAPATKETTSSSNWKNWVFASSALIALTVGVVIVSLNSGSNAN